MSSINSLSESLPKISTSRLATGSESDTNLRYKNADRGKNISDVDNVPILPSLYDDKMRRLLQLNPLLSTNRVHIPWYRRYTDVIPEKEHQHSFQPYREIQTRDEDIALQHQFGQHECMQEYVSRGMCRYPPAECKRIREAAMTRYNRIKKREEEKKEKKERGAPPPEDTMFVMPGHDIDLTTEFGFSANKKKLVLPVVEFLCKLHVSRERDVVRRRMGKNSKWHSLRTNATVKFNLEEAVLHNKRTA
ncbi:hypothetical protein ElyMa_003323600, partial [Elysia marginata]